LPQYLQDLGGWTNPLIVKYYVEYVRVLFTHLGDRVKKWITLNEPAIFCGNGYGGGTDAPGIHSSGVGDYLCAHHALLAHAEAYHLYRDQFYDEQGGEVGICVNSNFAYPWDETVDLSYVDKQIEFDVGKFTNPIFSVTGGYPQIMIDQIGAKSAAEGRKKSRLPEMTPEVRQRILGTADFLALNYYTSRLVRPRPEDPNILPSWWADSDLDIGEDPSWPQAISGWLFSVPEGFHDLLVWIKDHYNNPKVMITENGWSDAPGTIEDDYPNGRVDYLKAHLAALSTAITDGCNVVAYTVWSLTDNYEWVSGYTQRFGIHYIDFNSPDRTRVPKKSAEFFKQFMLTKELEFE